MRPSGKARRGRIPAVCDRGATQPGGMQRLSNAAGLLPRAARGHIWPPTLPPAAFREACPYRSAISELKKEGILRRRCRHRPVQYLNNIVEQDHRAIKRRVKAKQGFREFQAARRTIQGYEAMHMIRKGQARWVSGSDVRRQIQFIHRLFEVAA